MRRRKIKTTFQTHSPLRRALNTISTNVNLKVYKQDKRIQESFPQCCSASENLHRANISTNGDETVNLYNCRSLSDCSFVHVTHAQFLFSSVFATIARLSPRAALLVNNLISQRQYHAIPQQWFERPETSKNTSFA